MEEAVSPENDVTLEDLMKELGDFGRFQISNFLLSSLAVIFSGVTALSYVFMAESVKHRCLVRECEALASAKYDAGQSWLEFAVGHEDQDAGMLRSCKRYKFLADDSTSNSSCSADFFSTTESVSCEGYVYDNTSHTVTNEWGLVCNDAWKRTLVGTIYSAGQIVGLPCAGAISDRVGRRTVLAVSSALCSVVGLARSFVHNYYAFIVLKFLEPVLGVGVFTASFVLCLELVGAGGRVAAGVCTNMAFALGEIILAALAWWLQDWRTLLRVAYAPGFFFLAYRWLLPEPVRWLMARGRAAQARVMLERAGRWNGVRFDERQLLQVFGPAPPVPLQGDTQVKRAATEVSKVAKEMMAGTSTEEHTPVAATARNSAASPDAVAPSPSTTTERPTSMGDVMRSPILLCRFFICCFCWMTNTFLFYGLSLFSMSFRGSSYLNFMLSSLIEMPAYLCMLFVTNRVGRRLCVACGLVLSGVGCFFLMLPIPDPWQVIFLLASKFCVTFAFSVIYVYTAELFPTSVRHSLISCCSMTGRLGSVVAPQTPLLATMVHPLFPVGLFGTLGLGAGMLALLLPETVHSPLPSTVAEAERVGRGAPPPAASERSSALAPASATPSAAAAAAASSAALSTRSDKSLLSRIVGGPSAP